MADQVLSPTPKCSTRRAAIGNGLLAIAAGSGITSGIAAGAAASVADYTTPADPNTELLLLGAQLEIAWVKMRAWDEAGHTGVTDAEVAAVIEPVARLVDRIQALPACTLPGLYVKARAILWCNSGEEIDDNHFSPEGSTADARLAAPIVRDLLSVSL